MTTRPGHIRVPEAGPNLAAVDPVQAVGAAGSKEFFLTEEDGAKQGPESLGNKVWIDAPGHLRLYKDAMGLLVETQNYIENDSSKHVDQVTAIIREKKLFLVPGAMPDKKPTPVSWSVKEARINLSTLFKRAHVDVESGYRELYPCSFETETPYGPAFVVDLTQHEKRRTISSKRKGNQSA